MTTFFGFARRQALSDTAADIAWVHQRAPQDWPIGGTWRGEWQAFQPPLYLPARGTPAGGIAPWQQVPVGLGGILAGSQRAQPALDPGSTPMFDTAAILPPGYMPFAGVGAVYNG